MRLPSGVEVAIFDQGMRQMVIPIGTTLRVPEKQTWTIVGMAVLPTPAYEAPCPGCDRNALAWGEVCLRSESGNVVVAMNTLTLMDRYWGRYNMSPNYPDIVARLEHVSHAMRAAPSVIDLLAAIEMSFDTLKAYTTKIAPVFDPPFEAGGGTAIAVEFVTEPEKIDKLFKQPDGKLITAKIGSLMDVELTVFVKKNVE